MAIDRNVLLSGNQCLLIKHKISPWLRWLPQVWEALVYFQNYLTKSKVRNVQENYVFFSVDSLECRI